MNRTCDPERVNALSGLDLSGAVAEPLHVFLEEGESLGCFVWRGPGIYEIHLVFAERGRKALDLLCRMIARMCDRHNAKFFWAAIPLESRHVRMFARLAGFQSDGTLPFADGDKEIFVSESNLCRH
jgi:hypothetical protein